MGNKFAYLACKSFLIFPALFVFLLAACFGGVTPVPSTAVPTLTLTTTPEIATYRLSLEKSIGQGIVQAVDWAPDGQSFVIATSLQVDLYDAKTLKGIDTFATGQSNQGIKYSPDSHLLAIALDDGTVQIWDILKKSQIHSFTGNGIKWGYNPEQALSFSSDSQKLAIANDQTVYILDVTSGKLLDTFPGHGNSIITVAFNQQGNTLLAATNRQVFVRDLASRELLYPPVELKDDIKSVFFDSTEKTFFTISTSDEFNDATSDLDYVSHLRIWDSATGSLKNEYEVSQSNIYDIAVNLAQGKVVVGGDSRIEVWDMSTWKVTKTMPAGNEWVDSLAFSPDGSQLISIIGRWTGVTQLWDLSTYKAIKDFDQYSIGANVQISPDGRLVAEAGMNRFIQVKDTQSGKLLYSVEGNLPMSFSPDGSILAFATGYPSQMAMSEYSDNLSLEMVEAVTGKQLPGSLDCSTLSAVAFSPDGKTVAYGGENHDECKLQIREIKSRKIVLNLQRVEGNENLYFDTLAFSPDGKKLALGGYHPAILDVKTGQKLGEFEGFSQAKVAFSPDS
jgi:WD40 repeat protein